MLFLSKPLKAFTVESIRKRREREKHYNGIPTDKMDKNEFISGTDASV